MHRLCMQNLVSTFCKHIKPAYHRGGFYFLAHMSTECSVSNCSHSPSVDVRPSAICLLTLASTNINQSSPNLVKMYMTTRPRMTSIMEPIGPELSELSALEFENLPYLTMFTL